jgi:hypothetical protein
MTFEPVSKMKKSSEAKFLVIQLAGKQGRGKDDLAHDGSCKGHALPPSTSRRCSAAGRVIPSCGI